MAVVHNVLGGTVYTRAECPGDSLHHQCIVLGGTIYRGNNSSKDVVSYIVCYYA